MMCQFAAKFASENGAAQVDEAQIQAAAASALRPFENGPSSGNPYEVQHSLQERMQELVGIVRTESEMCHALDVIAELRAKSAKAGIGGNRQYNTGWHTAMDLANLLDVSEAITRAAILRKESRGAQFREDFPEKDADWGKHNLIVRRGGDGEMLVDKRPVTPMPDELKQVIEEMK